MSVKGKVSVNFFSPSTLSMHKEVSVAKTILLLWAALSFGIPVLIWLSGAINGSPLGESWFTRTRFLGFPLHYWLIAQGCTIGYVLLCKFYCVLWDYRISRPIRPPRRPQL